MHFTQTATLALGAALSLAGSANAAAWSMTSWTGQACSGGLSGNWAVGPKTNSCITFASVLSLYVNTEGPCKTYYYSDNACKTSSFIANGGICNGFNGAPVGSFKVVCTA